MFMKKVAVILSGSGVYDGSEIHESTLTLFYLDQADVEVVFAAPNIQQKSVVNHLDTSPSESKQRSVLEESARIARGPVSPIQELSADDLDALILPGGFGAAKNLSNFAFKGSDCDVEPSLAKLIQDMYQQSKPIAAMCIAPVILSKLIPNVTVTIGNDEDTAMAIQEMGAIHQNCSVSDIVIDEKNKVITTPAYMLANSISEMGEGIKQLVDKVLQY